MIALLKVFLVEDECVVREGLRDCIDWERYGFEFCGDAPDGELALPQIRKLRPDILITDIKMPFMDGLALSKLVCAELPETRIILISGHNDFEFAQEAIEIGVEQYLLKPVTKSSLLKTLEDVSRKIDEEREQKAYLRQFQQEGQEYEQYARRKFFEQVTSGSLRVSEIYEQAKKLQIDIDAEGYTVILLTLQSRGAAEYSQTLADRLEELMAYLLRYGEYLLFRCNLMTYCVIVKGSAAGLDEAGADALAGLVTGIWGDLASLTVLSAWLGLIGYALQLYFDFSGYSDMAIGLGRMFGFHFLENFNYPYVSRSVTEFWRRWHISLSTWFRDYVYIPLGGNRCSRARNILNLFLVWALTGLWHGASWNFVLWGVMLLGFILLEKFCIGNFLKEHKVLSHVYLLFVIPQTWVIFRITRLKDVGAYFSRLFPLFGARSAISAQDALKLLSSYWWLLLLAVFFCLPQPRRFYEKHRGSLLVQLPLFLLFWVCVYFIATSSGNAFLYSRF